MKKNILKVTLVAAFALFAGYNVYTSQKPDAIFDLALANVEALARYEIPNCSTGCLDNGNGCLCGIWHPVFRVP